MQVVVRDLGGDVPYRQALALQEQLHAARVAGSGRNTLLLLEHRAVFTLGSSATRANVLWNAAELQQHGLECVNTSRGGDVTYHGPGQLVGYPILYLPDTGLQLVEFITALEETLIRTVATFGVQAARDARNRGVWVGNAKLAAIGIRVSRRVTMHGFALNVAPRMADYRGIVACGLKDARVTSLAELLPAPPTMTAVKQACQASFAAVFKAELLQGMNDV